MNTRSTLALCLALAGAAIPASAQSGNAPKKAAKSGSATPPRSTKPKGAPTESDAAERAFLAAEEKFYAERMLAERSRYLAQSGWAELGDRCNPGALRVFPNALSAEQRDSVQRLVEGMESTLIARGVGAKLDTPEAQSLLRVIVGWEAGIDRPRWDSDDKVVRSAIAAGLTGEVPDPRSDKCLPSAGASDSVTFVIPGFQRLVLPKVPRPVVKVYFGAKAQQNVRNDFFVNVGQLNPEAELSYFVVAPVVLWREWALVAVRRPREKGGVDLSGETNGGAVYMLRRVGNEWRLLSIVRSWGA